MPNGRWGFLLYPFTSFIRHRQKKSSGTSQPRYCDVPAKANRKPAAENFSNSLSTEHLFASVTDGTWCDRGHRVVTAGT